MDPTAPKDPLGQGASPSPKSSIPKDPVQPGQFVVAGEEDGIFKQPPPISPATSAPKTSSPPSYISSPNQTVTDSSLNNNASTPNLGGKTDTSPLGWSSQSQTATPQSPIPSGNLAGLSTKSPLQGVTTPSLSEESSWPSVPNPSIAPDLSTLPQTPSLADISSIPPPPQQEAPSIPQVPLQPAPFQAAVNQPSPEPFVPPTIENSPLEEPSKIKSLRKIAIIAGAILLIGAVAAAAWFFVISKRIQKEPAKTEVVEEKVEEPPQIPKKTSGGFSELPPIPIESTREATQTSQPN